MTTMTTATLAPFVHATEHPDYIAARDAREAASNAYDDAKRSYWISCEVAAEWALEHNGGQLTESDRLQLSERRAIRDAADAERERATTEWHETRVRLGLKDARL